MLLYEIKYLPLVREYAYKGPSLAVSPIVTNQWNPHIWIGAETRRTQPSIIDRYLHALCTPTHCTMSQMALPRSTLAQISTHVCSLKTGDSHLILWAECRNKLRLVIWLWYVMTSIKDNLYINICQFCFHTVANPFYCLWTPYIFLFVIIMYLHQS